MNVPVWKLNAVQVLGFACFGLAAGIWVKRKFPLLDRLNIPAAIVGGMMFALMALVMRDRILNLDSDLVLRDILMIAFFTTIGMGASLKMLRAGGVQVGIFFAFSVLITILQNVLGSGIAKLFGLNPLVGILAGSVALTGGPATALAFGQSFEQWGVVGAPAIGLAAAMFGIVAGGLIGGPCGGSLITRFGLKSTWSRDSALAKAKAVVYADDPAEAPASPMEDESDVEQARLMSTVVLIAVAMGIGSFLTGYLDPWLKAHGFALPAYIGAMMAASVLRNIDDATGWFHISQHTVDGVGEVALNIFIVMALMTLQLWTLVNLALPLLAILVLQGLLVYFACKLALFALMGRDYDSAVMCGGFCGFMMGTSANALANMGVLTAKYGPAPRAYLVVPLVGAFLIDFANAILITTMANFMK
jgi:glutamate:Na+ symporter, ESS family